LLARDRARSHQLGRAATIAKIGIVITRIGIVITA
jgi:hypothetical protein